MTEPYEEPFEASWLVKWLIILITSNCYALLKGQNSHHKAD